MTKVLVEQLKKDFGSILSTNPEFKPEISTYDTLFDWIHPFLEQLYKNDRQRFTSLIYVVDANFMKQKFGQRNESEIVQWTHAILLRECLKVFIRLNYKVNE